MKIGKVPHELLEKTIIGGIQGERPEVLVRPRIGEDCSVLEIDNDELLVLSTDPITGATENIGQLAVYINANDIASSGGEPIGLMVTLLLPPETTESQIQQVMKELNEHCRANNMDIIGGHTEITDAVVKPVISVTAVGKVKKDHMVASSTAKVNDDVIMTKWAALEGTAIIANDHEEDLTDIDTELIKEAKGYMDYLSVIQEGKIASTYGVHAMHDVTEGGILGAAWELAACSNVGIEIDVKKIPIKQPTIEICKYFKIDPYRLISSGCMIIAAPKGEGLIKQLRSQGVEASIIGKITGKQEKWIIDGEKKYPLEEPEVDELYRV
ncbi:AIR synthase family protein [Vallitalea okinawensis]|uniref:AIR synthase family protein n=1 Tax=Vallitalea okinawensis TaxID=2078660 RepID=UPI000CFBCA2B|nr:AIR synthase family protein [Vallitalea okinawensis]